MAHNHSRNHDINDTFDQLCHICELLERIAATLEALTALLDEAYVEIKPTT